MIFWDSSFSFSLWAWVSFNELYISLKSSYSPLSLSCSFVNFWRSYLTRTFSLTAFLRTASNSWLTLSDKLFFSFITRSFRSLISVLSYLEVFFRRTLSFSMTSSDVLIESSAASRRFIKYLTNSSLFSGGFCFYSASSWLFLVAI